MEYRIDIEDPTPLDLPRVADAVQAFDPAAVVDFDTEVGRLRVGTLLSAKVLVDVLNSTGIAVQPRDVRTPPSTCCGGCGG